MHPQPAIPIIPAPAAPTLRRYDLDWLRVIAIVTLLFYHTGMIYVSWGWHIKSQEHSSAMEEVMRWLHRWRMPLLFFISGAGSYFALQRRTFGAYAGERVRRLFIPLVFGMFVVVPPQIYYEWLFRGRFSGSYAQFYPEVFNFQPYQDGGTGGAFSWHHLWFVAYLFIYSLVSIPFFRWIRSDSGQRFVDRVERSVSRPGRVLLGVVGLWAIDVALGGFFPNETHALIDDWAYFTKNLFLFWAGYVLISRPAFWQLLTDQRRILLGATLLFTLLLYGSRALLTDEQLDANVWIRTLYSFNSLALTWSSVLMTVAYGYWYLNKNRPALRPLNEGVYPFYILHQTVIVVVGYYVLTRLSLGVWPGFFAVSLASGLLCVAAITLLIRPFKLTRLLFGMK